jgi:NAD(P)H-flavin reductase
MNNEASLLEFELQTVQLLTPFIRRLILRPLDVFSYQAGDYIMLGLDSHETKPFSIANAPRLDGCIELHIRHQESSDWMNRVAALQPGARLWVDGPKPQMKLAHESDLNLFIAGGTGLSPIKALLEQRIQQGITQPTKLYFGARRAEELYLDQELQALSDAHPLLDYIPVVSDEVVGWSGIKGLVHEAAIAQNPDLSQATVYLCGAWAMVKTAETDFVSAGLPKLSYIS